MGLVSYAISNVFQTLADEVSALGALGPIDYIDYKANNISLKVDEVVENIEDWLDTSTPTDAGIHSDAVVEEVPLAGAVISDQPTLKSIADEVTDRRDEITDIFNRWWLEQHPSETVTKNAATEDSIDRYMNVAETAIKENAKKSAVNDAVNDFFNARIPALQKLIAETAKKFDASRYDDPQEYLQDIFDLASVKCGNYMKSEVEAARDEANADLLMFDMITEERVKENVVLIAAAMFIDMEA